MLNLNLSKSLDYSIKGDERLNMVIFKEIEDLKNKVHELETKKILDETQLPQEILEENNMFPCKPRKLKRGRGYRPIMQSEIEEAKKHAINEKGAARWMGIGYYTYRKYCKLYGIWDPKPCLKGKYIKHDPDRGKYALNRILKGEFNGIPAVTDWMVKDRLIRSGLKPQKCEKCGLDEKRTGDNKVPLLLNHIDGDVKNFKGDNLQFLCLNCMFYTGRGYIRRGRFVLDSEWIERMNEDVSS